MVAQLGHVGPFIDMESRWVTSWPPGSSAGPVQALRNQFGRKSREPLELPLGRSVFNHDVAALDVTEVTQSLEKGLSQVEVTVRVELEETYSRNLGRRLLRPGDEWRGEEATR